MANKRKPAQVKYDTKKPTISFRLDAYEKKRLDEYTKLRGISYADFVKECIGLKAPEVNTANHQDAQPGYEDGFIEGADAAVAMIKETPFNIECPGCHSIIEVQLEDENLPEVLRPEKPQIESRFSRDVFGRQRYMI